MLSKAVMLQWSCRQASAENIVAFVVLSQCLASAAWTIINTVWSERSSNLLGGRTSSSPSSNGNYMPCATVQLRSLQHPVHRRDSRHA